MSAALSFKSPTISDTLPPAGSTTDFREAPHIPGTAWPKAADFELKPVDTSFKPTSPLASTAAISSITGQPATLLAEWNGCVLEIGLYFFSAELKGIFGEGIRGERQDAEIPLSDVSDSDKELLHPGNFFRLCVFYQTLENGQRRRYTQVVFRRLPAYRAADLARAAVRASELHQALRVE